jgi:HEAT repeat protein
LQGPEVESFRHEWPSIALDRRREVVRKLVELSEDSFELDFETLFRLALEDSDPEVRVTSLEGLWESENTSLVHTFVTLLQQDDDERVRAAAAQALGKFVLLAEFDKVPSRIAARMEAALLATLDASDTPLLVRRRALEAIAPRNIPGIPARIEAAYHSEEPDEQLSAIFAMGRTSDPRWLAALMEELQHDDAERRYEAAVACGEIEDARAVPALRRALSDDDRDVQLASISALGCIGGREARQALIAIIERGDEQLQGAAEEALEEMSVSEEPFNFGISRS